MVLNRHDLLEHAKQLPPEEREQLARDIWSSMNLDPDDPPLSPEWQAEIQRRIDDIDSGRVKTVPYEEALAEARALFEKRRRETR